MHEFRNRDKKNSDIYFLEIKDILT